MATKQLQLAELDDRGNVVAILTSTKTAGEKALKRAADPDDDRETRNLVEWDGGDAEQAYRRRWDGAKFVAAEKTHVERVEKEKRAALRQLEADQKAAAAREA